MIFILIIIIGIFVLLPIAIFIISALNYNGGVYDYLKQKEREKEIRELKPEIDRFMEANQEKIERKLLESRSKSVTILYGQNSGLPIIAWTCVKEWLEKKDYVDRVDYIMVGPELRAYLKKDEESKEDSI